MSEVVVPNQPPSTDPGAVRLAIVGEAPAVEECFWAVCSSGHGFSTRHWMNKQIVSRDRCERCGTRDWKARPTPFVGESGRLLNDLLLECGLPRERVFVGNCSRVPLSEAEKHLDDPSVRAGLARLSFDLEAFKPNCVLLLGNLALWAFSGSEDRKVSEWRASLFEGSLEGTAYKCCAAMHPAAILREPSQLALLRKDVARAVDESSDPALVLPERRIEYAPTTPDICERLRSLQAARMPLGFDIEGGCDVGVTVMSFAPSSSLAFSVPFAHENWSRVRSPEEDDLVWSTAKVLLEAPGVTKVMHQAGFERFVLAWLHGIKVSPAEDTLIQWGAMLPELDKGLDVVASVLTKQPFWGRAGQWKDEAARDLYNGIDSMVTLECWQQMNLLMTPQQRAYYEHQLALLDPVLDMELRGFRYDAEQRDRMVADLGREVWAMQGELDELAGIPHPTFKEVAETVAMKVKLERCVDWPDLLRFAKPSFREAL